MSDKKQQKDLQRLRELLVGEELAQLQQLSEHMENAEQFSTDVAEVLPKAMDKSAQQGDALSEAMVPTVENIVRLSIKRDMNKFADALFPVIGPAIRKSISEAIREKLQSLNKTLEYSLSWRGLKWRIESIRTGIPFAEIVLLKSLVYRVDQVFLIHRETGLLLNHVAYEDHSLENADVISSMLTAIADFADDSFDIDKQQTLESIQVGGFSVLIEKGPHSVLALAVRGNAPDSLRVKMQQTLEKIQSQFSPKLIDFSGNTTEFDDTRPLLKQCLETQFVSKKQTTPLRIRLFWLITGLLLLYWLGNSLYQNHLQDNFLKLLRQQPGYAITEVEKNGRTLHVQGLKDPLADDMAQLFAQSGLQPEQLLQQFASFQSLDIEMVKRRLVDLLSPPPNVKINVDQQQIKISGFARESWVDKLQQQLPFIAGSQMVDITGLKTDINLSSLEVPDSVELSLDIDQGLLTATGEATESWIKQTRGRVKHIDGLAEYDDSALESIVDIAVFEAPESVQLELKQGVLTVTGDAHQQWISQLRERVQSYPSIVSTDLSQLQNLNRQQLEKDIQQLNQITLYFDQAYAFNFEAEQLLELAATLAFSLIRNVRELNYNMTIFVRGFTDSVGQFEDNVVLSRERADYVAQYLFNSGINPKYIAIEGMQEPPARELSEEERQLNRKVTFEVVVSE